MPRRETLLPFTLLMLVISALLFRRLDTPWTGAYDANGIWISAAVRNYEALGARELGFVPVTDIVPLETDPGYYVHHPPMVVWVMALASQVFGQEPTGVPYEAVARFTTICQTLISLAALYVIARRLLGYQAALLALALYCATPMIAYYGRMPNHEPIALVFSYLTIAVYINWMRRPTRARWWAMVLLAILAVWSAWATIFYLVGMGLLTLILGSARQRYGMVTMGILVLLSAIAIPLYYEWQVPGAVADLVNIFYYRTSDRAFRPIDEVRITPTLFVVRHFAHFGIVVGLGLAALGVGGLYLILKRPYPRLTRGVIWLMVLGGLAYILVFRNASFIHGYYKVFMMGGLSIAAAVALPMVLGRRRRWLNPVMMGLLVGSFAFNAYEYDHLHRKGETTLHLELAEVIAANTPPGTMLYSNLEAEQVISHYADRTIEWNYTTERVLKIAEDRDVLYFYCDVEANTIPDELADYPRQEVFMEKCFMIQLDR